MTTPIKTLCPYCGVGCGLEVLPDKPCGSTDSAVDLDPIQNPESKSQNWKVRGDRSHPSSKGMVCVKGATVAEPLTADRLLYPMLRESLDQPFQRVSWDQAFDRIVWQIRSAVANQGADAVCLYGSGQFQTEDYYVAQKLMKGGLGTNNFDANSRLCMSSAVAGYVQSLGADGPPCCYDDLEQTDCAFIIGSNTAECHPIAFNRLRKYHKQNSSVKMIVVDPRRTPTAEAADLHLAIKPGTDIDLLNGMAHLLLQWGAIDALFIDECTTGFPGYAEVVRHYPPDVVADRCGISVADLETAARFWQESQRILSLWSMGINQSSEGTAKVRAIINLHLMTGTIGKPGSGPFSLTGQPNAMGGREAGGLAHLLPGYRSVKNPQHRAEVEQAWGLPSGRISPHPGRSAWEMITGVEAGAVEFLWIAATNPMVSMPDLERTRQSLRRSPFTVYQDVYHPTETAAYAHLLLPAAQWSEKTGTMTNSERVITYCPAFRQPPGEAKPDWEIFAEVGRRLGHSDLFHFADVAAVRSEFVQLTQNRPCDQSGITHASLQANGPLQWPCPASETFPTPSTPDTPHPTPHTPHPTPHSKRLYTNHHFPTPDGRARFAAYHSKGLAEPPDPDYPMVLTTGRLYGHWHTQSRTGRIDKIRQMHPNPFIEIHPRDAERLEVQEGDWVEVRSRRGMARFPATITKGIAPGTVFVPMHWGELWASQAEANALTHPIACPDSLQPELKACAVQLTKISPPGQMTQSQAIDRPSLDEQPAMQSVS
ncbi:molybdopterin oxidoreductase family protein [Egbenema bharatensis]|uniref:molybdopterin oxidoreductase family protein n=1 Tax=Egbenema bharatensis TaxID=3463334 RepID=UPI003A8B31FE